MRALALTTLTVLRETAGACALLVALTAACADASEPSAVVAATQDVPAGTAAAIDAFHPDNQPRADGTRPAQPKPAYGGRAIVNIETMPKGLNVALDVSAVTQRIMYEVNETLMLLNWDTQVLEPDLCSSVDIEDTLIPHGGRGANVVFGSVREDGEHYVVTSGSSAHAMAEQRVEKKGIESLKKGTVFTFHLRPGVTWHDGHPFDARDVWFSWSIYQNPKIRCGDRRFRFVKIVDCQIIDPLTVRFFYEKQYFNALVSSGDMPILPSHLFDLNDPDNARFDAAYHDARKKTDPNWKPTADDEAEYVNSNPHNRDWIGLGPYRVSQWGTDFVEAQRYAGYFDKSRCGYLDTVRWRAMGSMAAGFQALLAGEIDYYDMLSADDYFGEATQQKAFTDRYYKGWSDTSIYWFVGWNLTRPALTDVRVRQALAYAFDFDEFKRSYYRGLANQATGPWPRRSPFHDPNVKPFPYDPHKAEQLLADAGWYKKNADGILEKDGVPLAIHLCAQSGNAASQSFCVRYQESLARIGVKLDVSLMERAALDDKKSTREFDGLALGWAPGPETDPEQVWHSRWSGADKKSSNFIGFQDALVDRLIDEGQVELDRAARTRIWRALHARVYELQPYLFCFNPPRKFALNKALRGFQSVAVDPNYVVRRWYYPEGTPGTRAAPDQ